jgi:hypothetical protein
MRVERCNMRGRASLYGIALVLATIPLWVSPTAFANHVHCGDVITEDTTLDSDLLNCSGTGIEIGASHITLDLGGHTIAGRGVHNYSDFGVLDRGHVGVTVKNGIVRDFNYGVFLLHPEATTVRGLHLQADGSGVVLYDQPTASVVEDNVVTDYGGGIFQEGQGITIWERIWLRAEPFRPAGNRVEDNIVQAGELAGAGIAVSITDANVIRGNRVSMLGAYAPGIEVIGFFASNPSDGNSAEGNVVEENSVSGPGRTEGIVLASYAHNNVVRSNDVFGFFEGITDVAFADRNVIDGNSVWNSIRTGIRAGSASYPVGQVRIVHNRVWGNDSDGIALEGMARDSVVERNRVFANGDDGIDVDRAGNEVTANRARANADWGIEAVPGVIDGGRNFAHKNGQPGQCLEIRCRPGH